MQTSHGLRFKEAWFLFIPADLANLSCHCFQSQRTTCFLPTDQCISFSMFYHRILPPPSNLAKAPVAGVKPPNGDTLLENRIIMSENQRLHTDRRQSQIQQHTPSFSDEQVQRAEDDQVNLSGGYATRSSARLSRKRDSDPSPEESSQLSRNRVASVSGEGPGTKLAESPSQLCLCQPDPKVPRPRNGENQVIYFLDLQVVL